MSQEWRSSESNESATSRWLRGRWQKDSLWVLDIDNLICDRNAERGLLIEWKRTTAREKNWGVTRKIARRLGWWAALFVYGEERGEVVSIEATFQHPEGDLSEPIDLLASDFDEWVMRTIVGEK